MKKINLALVAMFFGVLMVVSCGSKDTKKEAKATNNTEAVSEDGTTAEEDKNFDALDKALVDFEGNLPVKIDNDLTMSKLYLEDPYLVIEFLLDGNTFDQMNLTEEKFDKEMAPVLIKSLNDEILDACDAAAVGIKFVFLESESRESLIEFSIPLEELGNI